MKCFDKMFLWAFMKLQDEMIIMLWIFWWYEWLRRVFMILWNDSYIAYEHEHGWYEGDDVIYEYVWMMMYKFNVLASARVMCNIVCASARSNPQGVMFAKTNSLYKLTLP